MFISVLPLDFYMFKNFVALMPENISKDFRFIMLFTSIIAHQFLASVIIFAPIYQKGLLLNNPLLLNDNLPYTVYICAYKGS